MLQKAPAVEAEQGDLPALSPTKMTHEETLVAILRKLVAIEQRLDHLESVAHSDHSLGPEVVEYLTRHAMTHIANTLSQQVLATPQGEEESF